MQTKPNEVDYREYPSSKKVMKSVNGDDAVFTDKKGKTVGVKTKQTRKVQAANMTSRHQKIDKMVKILDGRLIRTIQRLAMSLLLSTNINIALKKHKLKHAMDLPLAVYRDSKGKVWYRTRAKATEVIRRVVKAVYPDSSKDELLCYRI